MAFMGITDRTNDIMSGTYGGALDDVVYYSAKTDKIYDEEDIAILKSAGMIGVLGALTSLSVADIKCESMLGEQDNQVSLNDIVSEDLNTVIEFIERTGHNG